MAKNFGAWLLGQIQDRQITAAEFAQRAKLSEAGLSNIISGNRFPRADTCNKIARGLGVPPRVVHVAAGYLPEDEGGLPADIEELAYLMVGFNSHQKKMAKRMLQVIGNN